MSSEQQYIDLFENNRTLICAPCGPTLNGARAEAAAALKAHGLPTRKVERYRYTDVGAALAPDYGVNLRRVAFPIDPYASFHCTVPHLSTALYFQVNDAFYGPAGAACEQSGVTVASLARSDRAAAPYYGRLASVQGDALTALNTMLAQDGLYVHVERGVAARRPVQIINIARADVPLMMNRRVLIVLDEGAQARLLLCDHTADDRSFLNTQVIEVFAGRNSRLELYELEETNLKNTRFSNLYVHLEAGADVQLGEITLHNGLTRNTTNVIFAGEGAALHSYGAVIGDGSQHIDNNLLVDHRVGGCTSDVLYKYVLDGHAVGAFAGRVLVRHGAQKTNSKETNANLCVSDTARMYTQPELEIYADDVQCNHGSSVGNLDRQALFYMRQRGLSEAEAHLLLQHAFLNDVVRRVTLEPLRDRLSHLIEMRFRGELDHCRGCELCR